MMFRTAVLAACCGLLSPLTQAQTTVTDPWVRGTVAEQKATGLFAQITSARAGRLVGAQSPVAGTVEIHEMRMVDGLMKMRAVPSLALPAGQPVALKPGGYHLMLLDLKQTLKAGQSVPVTLLIEGADGQRETVSVNAPVRALGGDAHSGH